MDTGRTGYITKHIKPEPKPNWSELKVGEKMLTLFHIISLFTFGLFINHDLDEGAARPSLRQAANLLV